MSQIQIKTVDPATLGRAVRKYCRSDASFVLIDHTAAAGGTWTTGGCWILADAIVKGFGGEVFCVMSTGDIHEKPFKLRPQHFVAKVGHLYLDADGASTERTLLKRWSTLENLREPSLAPFTNQTTGEIPKPEKADEIIAGIKENLTSKTASGSLLDQLKALRPELAKAAQEIYDSWQQDENGIDDELGSGGICDQIAQAFANIIPADTTEGGADGDDHSWTIAYDDQKAYNVDIPYDVYETGGGYSWKKRQDVVFTPEDIEIEEVPRSWIEIESDKVASVTATPKTAREGFNEDGYWVGTGGGASGILPIARDTKRICLAWRSIEVQTGECWGTIGGAIKDGMSPAESAKHEMAEETGYHGGIQMHPAYVFQDGSFKYHNFIGLVDSEFDFNPGEDHGWETDFIEWKTLADIQEEIAEQPGNFHPGMITLFKQSADIIEKLTGAETVATSKQASPADLKTLKESLTLSQRDQHIVFAETFIEEWMETHEDSPYEATDGDLEYFWQMNYRIMEYDRPAECPAFMFLEYKASVKNAWVAHFTDHAKEIEEQGFTRGVSDPNRLALTMQLHDEEKQNGGYNFGFVTNTPEARSFLDNIQNQPGYGSQVVFTQVDYILCHHQTDRYDQAIFWGADAKKRVAVVRESAGWSVLGQTVANLSDALAVAKDPNRKAAAVAVATFTYENDCVDSYGGETFCHIFARNDEGEKIGKINYGVYEDEIHIKMVSVEKPYRRQGIGTGMVEKLRSSNPGMPINWGMFTDDGAAFHTKVHKDSDTPPNRLLKELEDLRGQMAAEAQQTYNEWPLPEYGDPDDGLGPFITSELKYLIRSETSGFGYDATRNNSYVIDVENPRGEQITVALPASVIEELVDGVWHVKQGVTFKPADFVISVAGAKIAATFDPDGDFAPRIAAEYKQQGLNVDLRETYSIIRIMTLKAPAEKPWLAHEFMEEITEYAEMVDKKIFIVPGTQYETVHSDGVSTLSMTASTDGLKAEIKAFMRRYDALGWNVHVYVHSDYLVLSAVVVPKEERGEGAGTKFMQELCAIADAHQNVTFLTPSKDFGATSIARLTAFYRRFGFVPNKGRYKDFRASESMIRQPKTSTPEPTKRAKLLTTSPDFGYSQYNDSLEDQIAAVDFRIVPHPNGFIVEADIASQRRVAYVGCTVHEGICYVGTSGSVPMARGTGLGQMTYDHAIAHAKELGCTTFRSDSTLSDAASEAWDRLINRYLVTVIPKGGKNSQTRKVVDTYSINLSEVTEIPSHGVAGAASVGTKNIFNNCEKDLANLDISTVEDRRGFGASNGGVQTIKRQASPDFGYSKFVDRDAEIPSLKWSVKKTSGTIRIEARTITNKEYTPDGAIEASEFASTFPYGQPPYTIDSLKIDYVGLKQDWRGTGLGQMLYDRLISVAKQKKYTYLYADSRRVYPEAHKAWERLSSRYSVENLKGNSPYRINLKEVPPGPKQSKLLTVKCSTFEEEVKKLSSATPDVEVYGTTDDLMEVFFLDHIEVMNKGQGRGTAVLKQICAIADNYGYTITLDASPDYGSDVDRLAKFYERFGFVATGPVNDVGAIPMDRESKRKTKAAGMGKNPPGKPETVYPERSNGWALFPDQRGDSVAPSIDELMPEEFKKAKLLTASPDFGYSQYNDAEADLKKLKFKTEFDMDGDFTVGIQSTDRVAPGYISCVGAEWNGESAATVAWIEITPKWKGSGLGQILYDKAIQAAKKHGYLWFTSDDQLSQEAISAWQRIKARYPVVESDSAATITDLDEDGEVSTAQYAIDLRKVPAARKAAMLVKPKVTA